MRERERERERREKQVKGNLIDVPLRERLGYRKWRRIGRDSGRNEWRLFEFNQRFEDQTRPL